MLSCSIWFSALNFWIGGGLDSRCVGRVHGADGARHHPHRTHDPRSGFQDHHTSTNSVQKTICCNSTSNAPDDGRMYPKHVELRIHQQKLPCCIKLVFHIIWQGMFYSFVYLTLCSRTWYSLRHYWCESGSVLTLCLIYRFITPASTFRGTSVSCVLQAPCFRRNSISFSYFRFLEPNYLESLCLSP